MTLPYKPVDVTLAVDDVLSAELATAVEQSAGDAALLFGAEHQTRGREKGKHDVVTIFAAVAQLGLEGITENLGRAPEARDMTTDWAVGFEVLPRIVGRSPLFEGADNGDGIFIEWRIADPRGDGGRGTRQMVTATPGWNGPGLPKKFLIRTNGRDGALRLGSNWPSLGAIAMGVPPGVDPEIVPIDALTLGIFLM